MAKTVKSEKKTIALADWQIGLVEQTIEKIIHVPVTHSRQVKLTTLSKAFLKPEMQAELEKALSDAFNINFTLPPHNRQHLTVHDIMVLVTQTVVLKDEEYAATRREKEKTTIKKAKDKLKEKCAKVKPVVSSSAENQLDDLLTHLAKTVKTENVSRYAVRYEDGEGDYRQQYCDSLNSAKDLFVRAVDYIIKADLIMKDNIYLSLRMETESETLRICEFLFNLDNPEG